MATLRQFRIWGGNPSFRLMAQRCGQRAAASTMCAVLLSDELPGRLSVIEAIVMGSGGREEDRQRFATAWRRLTMGPGATAQTGPEMIEAEMIEAVKPQRPVLLRALDREDETGTMERIRRFAGPE